MSLMKCEVCPFEKQEIKCKICEDTEGAMQSIFCESSDQRLLDKITKCTGIKLKPVCGMISPVCEFCRCRIDQFDDTFQPQQKEYVVEKVRTNSDTPDDDPFNCLDLDVKSDTSELLHITDEIKEEDPCDNGDIREVAIEAVLQKAVKEDSVSPVTNHENTRQDFTDMDGFLEEDENHDVIYEKSLLVELPHSKPKEKIVAVDPEQSLPKRPTKCKICGKSVSYLKDHMRLHDDQKKFKCPHCDRSFTQSNNLIYHVRKHTGEKPFPCDKCDKSFICKSHLLSHMRSHVNDQPFVCEFCSKRFNQQCNLTKHLRIHSGEKPYKCKFCNKAFMNLSNMKAHEMRHIGERNFTCSVCSKSFYDNHHLERHLTTHSAEKQFKCELCPKEYRTANALKTHVNNCERLQGALTCDICQQPYATQKQLARHKKEHVDAQTQGLLQCTMCPRTFKKPKHLEKHLQRAHIDEKPARIKIDPIAVRRQLEAGLTKPYRCDVCSKQYDTSYKLKVHLRLHMSTDKMYKCEWCSRSFNQKDHLVTHTRIHTGEKPFACEYCPEMFIRRNELKNHQKAFHSDQVASSEKSQQQPSGKQQQQNQTEIVLLEHNLPVAAGLPNEPNQLVIKFEIKNI